MAKNSDRRANEQHLLIRVPRKKHNLASNPNVKTTYIEIPQVEETYAVALLKPAWLWGAEMGWNEFGVCIGNEALWTKEDYGDTSLIGMDLLRLGLERGRTAKEAMDCIIELLNTYGQGGSCDPFTGLVYHNSFMIADPKCAWVLETSGKYYAAKQVTGTYAISNCLTIEGDFDLAHPELVSHAVEMGWCTGKEDFSFARCYSDAELTEKRGGNARLKLARETLEKERGNITVETMKRVLRAHGEGREGQQFVSGSNHDVCMHSGDTCGSHSAGSFVAELVSEDNDKNLYFVTGSSIPCISSFKPVWGMGEGVLFEESQSDEAERFWLQREKLHRMMIAGKIDADVWREKIEKLEEKFSDLVVQAERQDPTVSFHLPAAMLEFLSKDVIKEKCTAASKKAFALDSAWVEEALKANEFDIDALKDSEYWTRMTKELFVK